MYKMIHVSKAALFIFDYMITFDDEVELIWSHWGIVEVVLYASRYSAWIEVCVELLLWFGPLSASGCGALSAYLGGESRESTPMCLTRVLVSVLLLGILLGQGKLVAVLVESVASETSVNPVIILLRTWAIWGGAPVLRTLFSAAVLITTGVCIFDEIEWISTSKCTVTCMSQLPGYVPG
ncbi:hypothetical protein AURDEDRAFT_153527 [Auricularia subglabra TFB-10046 SS5]|nr:hypothetical protein AURDEDRAFT_153527 [Auricularia subglabra TFB-10046 SS5]